MAEPVDPLFGDETTGGTGGGGFQYDFSIQSTRFGQDAGYKDGEAVVFILAGEGSYMNKERVLVTEPRTKFYSPGSNWKIADGGARIVHGSQEPGGKEIIPRPDTNLMVLFRRLSSTKEGDPRAINGLGLDMADFLRARGGDPRRAGLLDGLKFRFQQEDFAYEFSGEKQTRKIDLPIEYLGEIGGGSGTASSSAADKLKAAAAAASNGGGKSQLEKDALEVAKEFSSGAEFLNAVLQRLPQVAEDNALLDRIADGTLYAEAHSG